MCFAILTLTEIALHPNDPFNLRTRLRHPQSGDTGVFVMHVYQGYFDLKGIATNGARKLLGDPGLTTRSDRTLLGTSASLVVRGALLVVTRS